MIRRWRDGLLLIALQVQWAAAGGALAAEEPIPRVDPEETRRQKQTGLRGWFAQRRPAAKTERNPSNEPTRDSKPTEKKSSPGRRDPFQPRKRILPPEIPLGPGQTEPRGTIPPPTTPRAAEPGTVPYVEEETPGVRVPGQEPVKDGPAPTVLTLEEVLAAVDSFFPLLLEVQQERVRADGDIIAALGSFDLYLKSAGISNNIGFYQYERSSVGLEQQFATGGVKTFGGWRRGQGFFPVWYGDRETYGGGEFIAGARVPILRDRTIDKYRADLRKAGVARLIAEPEIQRARIFILRDGSVAYWDWLAAGQAYVIALSLLKIAEERVNAIDRRIEEGVLEGIERVDNQRVIVQRRAKLIAAQQKFQQATIKLSLFFRNQDGLPLLADPGRLPSVFPSAEPTEKQRLPGDVELALGRRPELLKIRLEREKATIDLAMAENQFLPSLDLMGYGSQDFGDPTIKGDKGPFTLEAGLYLDVPLQRRYARGRIQNTRGLLTQIAFREQFARDKVVTEVQNAVAMIEAAYRQIGQAREGVELARTMEQAERTRLFLGDSNILFVNLREMATVDAALLEVDALLEYYRSIADYRAALAIDADIPSQARSESATGITPTDEARERLKTEPAPLPDKLPPALAPVGSQRREGDAANSRPIEPAAAR